MTVGPFTLSITRGVFLTVIFRIFLSICLTNQVSHMLRLLLFSFFFFTTMVFFFLQFFSQKEQVVN